MLPIIGYEITLKDIFKGLGVFCGSGVEDRFAGEIRSLIGTKYIFPLCSGTAAAYVIFKVLGEGSQRKEVILPAYTASHLALAAQKAGLNIVLCDVEEGGFNMDVSKLFDRLSDRTSCVVSVHMFGLPMRGIAGLKQRLPGGVFLVEDAAQAFGSRVSDKYVGAFGDFGFFSFNRGKNLPTYGGGCIVTDNEELAARLDKSMESLKRPGFFAEMKIFLQMFIFKAALNRAIYSMARPWMRREDGNTGTMPDFNVETLTGLQECWAIIFLKKFHSSVHARLKNTKALIEGLKGCKGVVIPEIEDGTEPVLNRFPIMVEDAVKKRSIQKELLKAGIEAKELYPQPLHHIFELGYKADDFPCANAFAERHLTLPVHPLVREHDIEKMVGVIKKTIKG